MEKCRGIASVNAPQGDCLRRIVPSTGDSPDSTAFSPAVLLIEQRFFHRTVPDETLDGVGSRTPDTGTHRDLAGKGKDRA